MQMKKKMKAVLATISAVPMSMQLSLSAAATSGTPTGNVSGVIEQTWQSAAQQIKTVVNNGAATRCC